MQLLESWTSADIDQSTSANAQCQCQCQVPVLNESNLSGRKRFLQDLMSRHAKAVLARHQGGTHLAPPDSILTFAVSVEAWRGRWPGTASYLDDGLHHRRRAGRSGRSGREGQRRLTWSMAASALHHRRHGSILYSGFLLAQAVGLPRVCVCVWTIEH